MTPSERPHDIAGPGAGANADQIEYWNGLAGERWTVGQASLDRALAPFAHALLARAEPSPGEHAVDVGCGCGATTLLLADAVAPRGNGAAAGSGVGPAMGSGSGPAVGSATGSAIGVDISGPMLDVARRSAQGRPEITFVQADASRWRPDRPADLIVSRFGIMFFADPVAAFANLRAVLRPGGRLTFVCWRALGENPWMSIPVQATTSLLPPQPPPAPDAPGPFAFADANRVARILGAAGFASPTCDRCDASLPLAEHGLDEAVAFATQFGGIARLVADAPEELRSRLAGAVREALAPYLAGSSLALPGATWLVSARNPA